MRALTRTLWVELQRSILSVAFCLQTLLLLIWMYLNCFDILSSKWLQSFYCWQSVLNLATTNSLNFASLLMIIGTVSFAWSYCTDHSCGYLGQVTQRIRITTYGISKFAAVIVSSFLSAGIAVLIFSLLLQAWSFPKDVAKTLTGTAAYLTLVAEGKTALYLISRCLITALSCSLAAALAVTISAYLKNLYAAILSPLLLYLSVDALLALIRADGKLFLRNILFSQCFQDDMKSVLWAACCILDVVVLCGCLFVHKLRKENCA